MEKGCKFGVKGQNGMEINMRVSFRTDAEKDGEDISTVMVTNMREIGKTEIRMNKEFTILSMEMCTEENGKVV